MAGAFVDAVLDREVAANDQTVAVTYSTGNALLVGINYAQNRQVVTITDTAGNTYTELVTAPTDTAFSTTHAFVAKNLIGTSATITITYAGSTQAAVNVTEWSGLDTTTPTGGTATGTATSGTEITSGSLSAAGAAGDVVVAIVGSYYQSATWAAGSTNPSGFAAEASATSSGSDGTGNIGMGYAVLAAGYSGAVSMDPAGTTYGNIVGVVLKAAGGGGGPVVPVFLHQLRQQGIA
jgi:hypothetical protein